MAGEIGRQVVVLGRVYVYSQPLRLLSGAGIPRVSPYRVIIVYTRVLDIIWIAAECCAGWMNFRANCRVVDIYTAR